MMNSAISAQKNMNSDEEACPPTFLTLGRLSH